MVLAVRYAPICFCAPRPLGAAYVHILLCDVEQEQKPSENGDREAIVVGAGLCGGEGERAYTVYGAGTFRHQPFGRQKFQIFRRQ